MLRPSRPIIRPFISSLGNWTTETVLSAKIGKELILDGALVITRTHYDVIIIGTGTAGQTAAYELHKKGLAVAVVEKSDTPGGVCALAGCQAKKWFYEGTELVAKSRHLKGKGVLSTSIVAWADFLKAKNEFTQGVPANTVAGFKKTGIDITSCPTVEELRAAMADKGIEIEKAGNLGRGNLIDAIYKQTCRETLIQPCFLTGIPADTLPLARRNDAAPHKAERMPGQTPFTGVYVLGIICAAQVTGDVFELNTALGCHQAGQLRR